jgi:hypothetical protein
MPAECSGFLSLGTSHPKLCDKNQQPLHYAQGAHGSEIQADHTKDGVMNWVDSKAELSQRTCPQPLCVVLLLTECGQVWRGRLPLHTLREPGSRCMVSMSPCLPHCTAQLTILCCSEQLRTARIQEEGPWRHNACNPSY